MAFQSWSSISHVMSFRICILSLSLWWSSHLHWLGLWLILISSVSLPFFAVFLTSFYFFLFPVGDPGCFLTVKSAYWLDSSFLIFFFTAASLQLVQLLLFLICQ